MTEEELEQLITSDYSNIAGIDVLKEDKPVYEHYFNDCDADSHIHVYSCTKSIVSILIGIAIDQGLIKDVHQKILDFFPDYQIKRGEHTIQNITIENMLTMTVPYKYKSAPYTKYFSSMDWVKASLDLVGGNEPIGTFRYAPLIGPDILSGILASVTNESVLSFAQKNLFDPLGIKVPESIIFTSKEDQMQFYKKKTAMGWVADPRHVNTAGWGLHLSVREMASLGQMYLNHGLWNGKQIVSSEWVDASTKEHTRWKEQNLPYGYLWWVGEDGFAAMGDCGNIIYVNIARNMITAINCTRHYRIKDRICFIHDIIEPMFD